MHVLLGVVTVQRKQVCVATLRCARGVSDTHVWLSSVRYTHAAELQYIILQTEQATAWEPTTIHCSNRRAAQN